MENHTKHSIRMHSFTAVILFCSPRFGKWTDYGLKAFSAGFKRVCAQSIDVCMHCSVPVVCVCVWDKQILLTVFYFVIHNIHIHNHTCMFD